MNPDEWDRFKTNFSRLASGFDLEATFKEINSTTLFVDLLDEEGDVQEGKIEYVGEFMERSMLRVYTEEGNSIVSGHKAAFGLFYI